MLKPNKLPTYDGTLSAQIVNSWPFQVSQYLALVQMGSELFTDNMRRTSCTRLEDGGDKSVASRTGEVGLARGFI